MPIWEDRGRKGVGHRHEDLCEAIGLKRRKDANEIQSGAVKKWFDEIKTSEICSSLVSAIT